MNPVGDQSQRFTVVLGAAWLVAVALPISISVATGSPWNGLPLLGVAIWVIFLRAARWLSPASRADGLMRHGRYAEALALADRALAISGPGAWIGRRRLVWLNRRTNALIGLGRGDVALVSALEAIEYSADPETLGNCAMALNYLNRFDEAADAARQTLALTRERSLSGNAALATVMLAKNMPAEAEALARAGLADARALVPLVRTEHYAACLCALSRARRMQSRKTTTGRVADDLHKLARRGPLLRAMALCEDADGYARIPEEHGRTIDLLEEACALAPGYFSWFVTQRTTLADVRQSERFAPLAARATEYLFRLNQSAPTRDLVALTLASAQHAASPRPTPQASREALLMQVVTLSGTFALLIWWTWRFFLVSA